MCLLLFLGESLAKEQPSQIITWPESGTPVLKFTFGKFKELGSLGGQRSYITETTAQNLWGKPIPSATFSLYLYDKNKVRIGEGYISLNNVAPGQTVKFDTTIGTSGAPVSLTLLATSVPKELSPFAPPKKVSITINSAPQGATVKVDGADLGVTPKVAQLSVGNTHWSLRKKALIMARFPSRLGPMTPPAAA